MTAQRKSRIDRAVRKRYGRVSRSIRGIVRKTLDSNNGYRFARTLYGSFLTSANLYGV